MSAFPIDPMEAMEPPEPAGMSEQGEGEMGALYPFPQPEIPPHILKLRQQMMDLMRLSQQDNAAESFDEDQLNGIAQKVIRDYTIDKDSRSDWEQTARRAMDMARQKKEAKSTPWDGASNVKYPLLTTAALQFAARAYPAIVDGPRIVKTAVMGRDQEGQKAAAADRVSQHMSYQLLYEMTSWEADMDTALHQIPIVGCAFKKVYPDPQSDAGVCSDLVSAFDCVVNQSAKSLESVPRITHVIKLYPHEIGERIRAGTYSEIDIKGGSEAGDDDDAPQTILEQHRYWDSDNDGILEPWIVTVHEKLAKVLRVRPAFDMDKIQIDQNRGRIVKIPRKQYFVKIPFIPDPEGGFYDIGFGKLLEALSDVIDTTINQMMDAGTLQNSGGGFLGAGIQLGKSKLQFRPGEYHKVNSAGDDIRKSIVTMEHPGASPVLFQLLNLMIEAGKDIASVKDILTGETPSNQTATSTMAAIEQGLKVFTAIYKRIFRALKLEYKMIFDINKTSLVEPKYVALMDEPIEVCQADYMGDMDVMPVADPNTVTDMQRMAKAQFLMEQVQAGNPMINPFEATKRSLEAARIERVQDVLVPPPPPDQPPPPSPEEKLAEIKAQGLQQEVEAQAASAQITQQMQMADLYAKHEAMQIDMQAKYADMQAKLAKAELDRQNAINSRVASVYDHHAELRGIDIKHAQLDAKERETGMAEGGE